MNFDFISTWFLSIFPHGGEIVKLVASILHAFTAVLLLYICMLMFSLLIRATIPQGMTRQLHAKSKEMKTGLALMQAISGVAFSLQVGYIVMREPLLSFAMLVGFVYIVITNAIFFFGIRFAFPNRIKEILLENKISSGVEIGLLHLAWAIIMLGSMASRY